MDEVLIDIEGIMDISNLEEYASSIFMNGKLVFGDKKISSNLMGYKFLVSKDSFFQVNKGVTEKLYSKVLEYSGKGNRLIDLYCGTGTIGIILSKNYKEVLGVEINKSAVECALENKKINGILVQLPLPKHLDSQSALKLIPPEKDVDGFSDGNVGKLTLFKKDALFSCTPFF